MPPKSPSTWCARYARQVEKHGIDEVRRRGRRNSKKYLVANKDEINAKKRKKRRINPATRIGEIEKRAGTRKIAYALPYKLAMTLVTSPCAYCGGGDEINGIDRMDSSVGYLEGNVVAACATCNMAKGTLDPTSFVERCKQIALGEQHEACWSDTYPGSVSYKQCVRHAKDKGMPVELTESMFDELTARACFYCCRPTTHRHKNGVDRKDPAVGYTVDNSVPCCGECNLTKGGLTSVEFFDLAIRVAEHKHSLDAAIPRCPRVERRGGAYDMPVDQLDVDGSVLAKWPSIRAAAASLGRDMHESTVMARIKYQALRGKPAYGYHWRV